MRQPETTITGRPVAAFATLVAVALLGEAACRPTVGPQLVPPGALPSPESALNALRATAAGRQTIRAAGRVTYYGDKGRVRVRLELLAERPDRFRIETISPLEQPIDVMTCDGDELWLLSEGELRRGPATPDNVARLLPLPLAPSEVVDTLLGGIPTGEDWRADELTQRRDGFWRLVVSRRTRSERAVLTVDPGRQVVTAASLERPAGRPFLDVTFDDFLELSRGGFYPEKIRMKLPGRDADVRLKFKQPQINAELSPVLFKMTPPPGRRTQPL